MTSISAFPDDDDSGGIFTYDHSVVSFSNGTEHEPSSCHGIRSLSPALCRFSPLLVIPQIRLSFFTVFHRGNELWRLLIQLRFASHISQCRA